MWITLFCASWVLCGVLTYGIVFAYFQRELPVLEWTSYDRTMTLLMAALGPIGLLSAYMAMERAKYGILYFPPSPREEDPFDQWAKEVREKHSILGAVRGINWTRKLF